MKPASMNTRPVILIAFASAVLVFVSCRERTPAEKAGDAVEESIKNIGDAVEDAGDAVKDATN